MLSGMLHIGFSLRFKSCNKDMPPISLGIPSFDRLYCARLKLTKEREKEPNEKLMEFGHLFGLKILDKKSELHNFLSPLVDTDGYILLLSALNAVKDSKFPNSVGNWLNFEQPERMSSLRAFR
ncbi:unnamed protein product [Camellia sinensis]